MIDSLVKFFDTLIRGLDAIWQAFKEVKDWFVG